MSDRASIASAFGIAEDDPRIDTFIQRATAKGYMAGELADFGAGRTDVKPKPIANLAGLQAQGGPWRDEYRQPTAQVPKLPPQESLPEAQQPQFDPGGGRGKFDSFMNGMNDKLTFGIWPKATAALHNVAPSLFNSREYDEQQAAANPNAAALGKGTGMGIGAVAGPARAVGGAVEQSIAAVAPGLGRMTAAGLTGATTNAAISSAENGLETAPEAAMGGAAAGVGGALIARGAQGVANRVNNSAGGQARQIVDSGGPDAAEIAAARQALKFQPPTPADATLGGAAGYAAHMAGMSPAAAGTTAVALNMARKNAPWIAGRMLYTPTNAAASMSPTIASGGASTIPVQLLEAARAQQELEAARARRFRGGR